VNYKTHWRNFADSARDIGAAMRDEPYDLSHTVFVGFSMGGLVARQMVADGFSCQALISIATPHQGTAPWVPAAQPRHVGAVALEYSLARAQQQLR
jgi:pimeloyl-ACP methyl ester carboxylesterase